MVFCRRTLRRPPWWPSFTPTWDNLVLWNPHRDTNGRAGRPRIFKDAKEHRFSSSANVSILFYSRRKVAQPGQ